MKINYIFPYKETDIPNWIVPGPITNYVQEKYDYTFDFEIKVGFENILVIEGNEKFKKVTEYIDGNISNFLKENKHIKCFICSVTDPATTYEKKLLVHKITELELTDSVYYIESNMNHKNDKNTICWHFFIEDAAENMNHIYDTNLNKLGYSSEEIELNELDKFRTKKFLSFNKNLDKPHRFSLLYDYVNNDFSDSYFSFIFFPDFYSRPYHTNNINIDDYKKLLPIELDTQNLSDKTNFDVTNTLKKDLFLDSCIHLVTETSFSENEMFLSEKVLKPILSYQPFIVFSSYGYLKELKRLGFKTFSEFWDESYDDIEDPRERYFAIMRVVFELNSKSIKELNEIYLKTKNICIYNRNNFCKIKSSFENIINSLYNEK